MKHQPSRQVEFITETTLPQGVAWLCDRDLDLTRLVDRHGPPTRLWIRPPGFPTLVRIILEQQVSLASAQSTFDRLNAAIHLTPDRLLTLETDQLKGLGLSRQKAHYVQILAQAILSGELSLDPLAQQSDEAVRTELCKLKGIGPWTAEMYLMMALRRSDAWPVGDLALQIATQRLKGLEQRPKGEELAAIAAPWRPWRSVAAHLLWQSYLSSQG